MNRILSLVTVVALCTAVPVDTHAQTASAADNHSSTGRAVITEFPTASAVSFPQGIDIDEDCNIWYAETGAGKIAVLRPNHTTSEYPVPNGGQPITPKVANDGIWFTDGANHAIGNLNPDTGKIVEYPIPSGASPLFLQIAPDGSKWFSELTGVGRLGVNGVITQWDVTLEHPDDNIEQLSIDRSGDVWFAERNFDGTGPAGTNKVRRLNPWTNVISTYLVPTLGGNPAGVQANPDGTVWVSEYFANAFALLFPNVAPHTDEVVAPNSKFGSSSSAKARPTNLGRVQGVRTPVAPTTDFVRPSFTRGWVEYVIPTADTESEDMRVDRLGRLWYEGDTGFVGVLNPYAALFTQYSIPSVDSGYYNVALDLKTNRLWFTEAGAFAPVATKVGNLDRGIW
jgi:virginiamycin B lyase